MYSILLKTRILGIFNTKLNLRIRGCSGSKKNQQNMKCREKCRKVDSASAILSYSTQVFFFFFFRRVDTKKAGFH